MSELRRLRANGLDFAYFEEGDGPLVLMAHGFPDTAHTWDDVRPAVAAAGYRCITPFMRGYHPTEVPTEERFDSDTLGRDLLAIAEALRDRDAPAPVFVGHDWGASACYSAAGLAPHAMRLLVTVAIPHPAAVIPTPSLAWAVRHFFSLRRRGAAQMVRRDHFAYIEALYRRWSPDWNVPADESRAVIEAFSHPGALEAALGYYRALRPWPPPGQRRRVAAKGVAFCGTDDLMSRATFERARSRYEDTYEIIEMPGGHFMHREHPARFIRELLAALERHAPVG